MVKLIQNIPTANDGEQHKDNDNNNFIKYLESNKATIVDLAEKNFENPLGVLTNDSISSAAVYSSNSMLSLPQSSSTFPMLFFIYTFIRLGIMVCIGRL
jgi:hypothetical protein